jgi:hypothetical protein
MDDSKSERAKSPDIPVFAQAGANGHALATHAAIAGTFGRAKLDGDGGVALVGDSGSAIGGDYAILTGSGPEVTLICGDRGITFAADTSRELTVGEEGIVVAMKPAERVTTGRNAIVVLMEQSDFGPMVAVGEGSLVIVRVSRDQVGLGQAEICIARPGQAGLIENIPCVFWGSKFVDSRTDPATFKDYQRRLEQNDEHWVLGSLEHMQSVDSGEIDDDVSNVSASQPEPSPLAERIDPLTCERKIILCNRETSDAYVLTDRLVAKEWDADPRSLNGIFGLLWGIGDPRAAVLGYGEQWALVEVDSFIPTAPVDHCGHPGAVKFEEGLLVHVGTRGEILGKLIELGVEPDRLIGQVHRVGDGGHVEAGPFGAAFAGARGWAMAGQSGTAVAGESGFAEASAYGCARVGFRGIAVTDADGSSFARVGGVAVSRGKRLGYAGVAGRGLAVGDGRFKRVVAGSRGAAVSTAHGSRMTILSGAVAIGWGDISARSDCVAVSLDGTVEGSYGTLIVACHYDAQGTRRYVSGMVGVDGIMPDTRYCVRDGALHPFVE